LPVTSGDTAQTNVKGGKPLAGAQHVHTKHRNRIWENVSHTSKAKNPYMRRAVCMCDSQL
jgi:hypothetical protein